MAKVYKNTKLDLYLNTAVDISGASSYFIKAKKPSGTTVSLSADVESDNSTLRYAFRGTSLSEDGGWTFWAYVVYPDRSVQIGEPTRLQVFKEGQ